MSNSGIHTFVQMSHGLSIFLLMIPQLWGTLSKKAREGKTLYHARTDYDCLDSCRVILAQGRELWETEVRKPPQS